MNYLTDKQFLKKYYNPPFKFHSKSGLILDQTDNHVFGIIGWDSFYKDFEDEEEFTKRKDRTGNIIVDLLNKISTEYRVGDKLKITSNTYDHEFDLGEEVVIIDVLYNYDDTISYFSKSLVDGDRWYVHEGEFEQL